MHLGSITLGPIRVDAIDGGEVWLDGGAIFGVVPKPLWSRATTPDEANRIRLSFFSLLVRTPEATVVIEGGAASHQPPKAREIMRAAEVSSLVATLRALGVEPEDVDFFIPSHLHFDHVGGASSPDGASLTFPRAKHVFQLSEWKEANSPMPVNENAYIPGDISPLRMADLQLVEGDAEITPGVGVILSGGHAVGHQMVRIGTRGGETLTFAGDIIPTSEHLSPRWTAAFDISPADTHDAKVALLSRAAAEGGLVAPGHGGWAPICAVEADPLRKFIPRRVPDISPTL